MDPDNRDYVSCAECMSSRGRDIPPILILSGKQIKINWALGNNLDDDNYHRSAIRAIPLSLP